VAIVFARADGVAAWDRRLDITVRRERCIVIAAVAGDVDISTVARLRECLSELADSGRTLIVDLNRVTFIDSAGLGALVGAAGRADAHGGTCMRSAPGCQPAGYCG
jgi:anti-anti-sigma factor